MKLLLIVILAIVTVFSVDGIRVAVDRRQVSNVAVDSVNESGTIIHDTHDEQKGRIAADATAKAHGMVITTFHYNSVTDTLNVSVSGTSKTLVLHYFSTHIVDLNASASVRP